MASTTAAELYELVMRLPEDDRRDLIERLNRTVGDDDTSDEMLEQIRERLARVDRGEAKLITSSEAKERLRQHLAQRR